MTQPIISKSVHGIVFDDNLVDMLKTMQFSKSNWECVRAYTPHRCEISHRIIWPFTIAYVKIKKHKFMPHKVPPAVTWLSKEEYIFQSLKGTL